MTSRPSAAPPCPTALHDAEERFRLAFDHAPIGIALVSPDGRPLRVNRRLCEMTGHSEAELLARTFEDITHPEHRGCDAGHLRDLLDGAIASFETEKRCLRADGAVIWILLSVSLVRDADGAPAYFIHQVQDIDKRKRIEGDLQRLADHDPLTGLLNRRRFMEELERQVSLNVRYGFRSALLVLDLDHFKPVNDTFGHAAGDELLSRVGAALRRRLRRTDTVARLGGDEFAVLLPQADEREARIVAEHLLEEVRGESAVARDGQALRTTASIGIVLFDEESGLAADKLLMSADVALYQAKHRGRGGCEVLDRPQAIAGAAGDALPWRARLRSALDEERLVLYAQPVVGLADGVVREHELLLRMVDDAGDHIPPGAFLRHAAELGMMQAIDRWVIHHAVRMIAEHERAGGRLTLSVNVSAESIADTGLLAHVEQEITRAAIRPSSLILELAEPAAVAQSDHAKRLAWGLAELGCEFALDNFGSGLASLHYLKHLPFDRLKLDGDLIRNLLRDTADQLTVRAVVQIVRGLGRRTTAQRVEDQETLALLRCYGVDSAQGFHLGRPRPVSESPALARPSGALVSGPRPRPA